MRLCAPYIQLCLLHNFLHLCQPQTRKSSTCTAHTGKGVTKSCTRVSSRKAKAAYCWCNPLDPAFGYLSFALGFNIVLLQRRLCLKCIAHQQHEAQAESPLSSRDMEALLQDDEVIMPPTLPSNVSCHVHEYFRSCNLLS